MNLGQLPINNLKRNAGRTSLLMVLVALLAFVMFAGTTVVSSLQNGLASLESRLGADVIVVPATAKSTADLEAIMLEGTPGYFYMDDDYVDKIAAREGVEKVSPQYYLATVKAGCCSMPVQVIGIDPETDFTIQPWIARSYAKELGLHDIVAGCNITGAPGSKILFYGVECTIVGKLDETGTALDNAVFCNAETLKDLIRGSEKQGISVLSDNDPDEIVSTIQVKVADGYNVTKVVDDINLHVRGVAAVQARAMTSGVADSIAGVSSIIGVLVVVIWLLAVVVLVIAFTITGKQRSREFAVLRVLGASHTNLARIVMVESLVLSAIGAVVGIALAAIAIYAFSGALENALGLPFLIPAIAQVAAFAAVVLVVSLVVGPAASVLSARRLSKVDVGQVLREE